jgi:hypothetical protein
VLIFPSSQEQPSQAENSHHNFKAEKLTQEIKNTLLQLNKTSITKVEFDWIYDYTLLNLTTNDPEAQHLKNIVYNEVASNVCNIEV